MRNREENRVLNLVCGAVVLAASTAAFAGDVVPFFRPDPKPVMYGPDLADPVATECSARDKLCISEHDSLAMSAAIMFHDRSLCAEATSPTSCEDAYDMVEGEVKMAWDSVGEDPCAWVLLVDGARAKLWSKKLGVIRWVLDRGWTPGTQVGSCPIEAAREPEVPMPEWVVPVHGVGRDR